jgi:hypothetical protein
VRYERCCCLAILVGKWLGEGWGRGVRFGWVEAGWKLGGAVAGKPVKQVTFWGLGAGASSSKGTYWAWSDGLLKK